MRNEFVNTVPAHLILGALARFTQPTSEKNKCVEWLGEVSTSGYGRMYVAGRKVSAHRASWIAQNGPMPPEIDACHSCDNRKCVNEAHIFPGTRSENMIDAKVKGKLHSQVSPETMPKGERHGSAKLSHEQATQIRKSTAKTKDLVRLFGLHRVTIQRIRSGKLWKE